MADRFLDLFAELRMEPPGAPLQEDMEATLSAIRRRKEYLEKKRKRKEDKVGYSLGRLPNFVRFDEAGSQRQRFWKRRHDKSKPDPDVGESAPAEPIPG